MPALVTASPAQRCSTASRLPRHRVCQLPRVSRAQQLNSWWRGKLGLTRVYSGAFFFPSRNGIEPRRRRPASATASAGDGPVHQPFKKRPAVGRVPATCRSTTPAVNAVISVSSPRHLYVFFFVSHRSAYRYSRACACAWVPRVCAWRFFNWWCAPSNGWLVWGARSEWKWRAPLSELG